MLTPEQERILRELMTEDDVRRVFFERLRAVSEDYVSRRQAASVGESPQFQALLNAINSGFGLRDDDDRFTHFVLGLGLALVQTVVANNRKWVEALEVGDSSQTG